MDRFIVGSTERGRLGLVRQCRNRYDFDYEFGMCKCRSINGSGSFTVIGTMLCDQPGRGVFEGQAFDGFQLMRYALDWVG